MNITAPMVDQNQTFTYEFKAEKFLDGTGFVQVPEETFSIAVINGMYRCV